MANGFFYPLTTTGTLSAVSMFYLFIHGLSGRNPYEIVLALVVLLVFLLLLPTGYISARRMAGRPVSWVVPERPVAGTGSPSHLVANGPASVPYFFRLHFRITGVLDTGSGRVRVLREEPTDAENIRSIEIFFPFSGRFHGRGRRVLRDVFGLVRFQAGPLLHRSFTVLPMISRKKPALRIEPATGAEEKQDLKNADEERYFMREYAPGDRFRDINWKTSSRLAQLVTRISPESRQKTRIITVFSEITAPPPSTCRASGPWIE